MTALLSRDRAPARPQRAGGWLLSGIAAGAGFAFIFDPARGRLRRERIAGTLRHTRRRMARRARAAALQTIGRTKGALHELRPPTAVEPLDDAGLAHQVESVLFRDPRESVRQIAGVGEVVNLLHLPGAPAPHQE
jgi:hypothetical protein